MNRRKNKRRGTSKDRNQSRSSQSTLKVCTLSGTEEVGRNCNFIQYGNDIIIIDCGFSFPEQEHFGIDYLTPNISYLKENKDKVRAILITHGHLDHTGALQYVLPELDFPPIYGGSFANALIKEKLKEVSLEKQTKMVDVDRNHTAQFGQLKATFIGVTHSIPNSFSIFIESPGGNAFFSGDYKIDEAPQNEPETDYESLKSLRGKVDLALMESTNPEAEGKAASEKEIASNIEAILKQHEGRIVVAAFSSLVSRIYSVIQIAVKTNRKVFISGRSLKTSLRIAREQRYVSVPDDLIMDESRIKDYPDEKVLLICTGSQGERYAALNRISLDEHKYFKTKSGDMILLSASEIPSNAYQIEKMTDRLLQKSVTLIQSDMEDVHESGHALQLDMKMMYDLVQPKAVMPIHGSLTKRYKNMLNLVTWGANKDRIYLTQDGQIWEFVNGTWKQDRRVESKPILIDGLGVGDIGDVVLKDREQLSEYGMVVVVLNLSSQNKELIANPQFVSRGFVYVKSSKKLFQEMENIVKDIHREWQRSSGQKGKKYDTKELAIATEKALSRYIYKKTEREPMILTTVI